MLGLIIKDIFVCKKYVRTVFLLIGAFMVFSFSTGETSFVTGMSTLFFTMMTITTFAYDTAAKWDAYALTMPVSRSDMVFAKYAVSVVFALAGTILSILLSVVFAIIKKNPLTNEIIMVSLAMLGVALVFASIIIPLIYKFGTEKARMLMMAVFILPAILAYILPQTGMHMPDEQTIQSLAIFSPVIVLALFIASYYLSNHIFSRKEL